MLIPHISMWVLLGNQHVVLTARRPKEKRNNNNSNAFNIFVVSMCKYKLCTQDATRSIHGTEHLFIHTVFAPLPHKYTCRRTYTPHECVTALQLLRRQDIVLRTLGWKEPTTEERSQAVYIVLDGNIFG